MSRTSTEMTIAPDVFRWLFDTSGFSTSEISKKIDVAESEIIKWVHGAEKPVLPLTKVEQLSEMFKRPLAVFLLTKRLKEPSLPNDFRKHPDSQPTFSKETLLAIRRARRLQQIRRELMENLQISLHVTLQYRTLDEDPERVAHEERERSGIKLSDDSPRVSPVQAFEIWRDWFEEQNISVFKLKMPVEDARGFSLIDIEPYVIVVNSADADRARLFTLFHEYAHILLNLPAVCNQDSDEVEAYAAVERWCNHFAGAFLAPKEDLVKNKNIQRALQSRNLSRAAGSIQQRFQISKEAALMRLLTLNYISSLQFRELRERLRAEVKLKEVQKREKEQSKEEEEEGGFGVSLDKKCISEKGTTHVNLVLKNVQLGYISNSDALDFLEVKLKHLERFQESTSV